MKEIGSNYEVIYGEGPLDFVEGVFWEKVFELGILNSSETS